MRKLLLAALLTSSLSAQSNDDINYSFLELGYGYIDFSNNAHADGFYLDGAFELSDRFYLGGYYDNKDIRSNDFNRYGVTLGFHTNGVGNTDFYSEFELGRLDVRNGESSTYGLNVGSRTAFTDRFELISKLGYTHIDRASDGYYQAEVKGLFKLSEKHAITAGVESLDGDLGANVGFRFSF